MSRGLLKIFLGYASGVGKTYAMLEAGRQRRGTGVDVLVAFANAHDEADSLALLAQLKTVPPRLYDGVPALDVDAVLALRPTLALVDDLGRANPPGARHPRRYQDVEELLAAGINVYSTLNVQDIASLTDVVHQITGLTVSDGVPDSLMDAASEVELVDLPPEELLGRMREGKVHVDDLNPAGIEQFYRLGNLTALRELALRRVAERVDDQMMAYMQTQAITGPWPATERLLVCISASPLGERLVRATRRLADDLNAPWYVVHVDTPRQTRVAGGRERLINILNLAESLGGQVVTLSGPLVAPAVLEFAHKNNVTKIIAGKPLRPRWLDLLQGSTVDQLIRHSGEIDVYVISSEGEPVRRELRGQLTPHRPFARYGLSMLMVLAASLLGTWWFSFLDPNNLVVFYLIAVTAAALYLGRGPSLLASLFSVAMYELIFVVPRMGFSLRDLQYLLTFSGLMLVGLVISNMAALARDQLAASQVREAHTASLSLFSRELTEALNLENVLRVILHQVSATFSREVAIFLPENGVLRLRGTTEKLQLSAADLEVAHWTYEHKQPAGRGTETHTFARLRAIPLMTSRGIVAVMGLIPPDSTSYLDPDQRRLLMSFCSLSALALERASLAEEASQTQVLQAAERLQNALLNSISHDLRTPLATITGVLSSLKDTSAQLDAETQQDLLETALEEAGRLNRLVANLLEMTRLEAGALHLKRDLYDVSDLVGAGLNQVRDRIKHRPVTTAIPEDLPLVNVDFVMMNQVLVNLLDNAVKYSPPGTPIGIEVCVLDKQVQLSVTDEGFGIPPADLDKVFTKFFRVQRKNGAPGTGLGLSICRGIVEAHGGHIWAENRESGGVAIRMTLPAEEESPHEGAV